MIDFKPLELIELHKEATYLYGHNLPELVHIDDPACSIMIDLRNLLANITHPEEPVDAALDAMKESQVRSLLVINREGYIKGIIDAADIQGEKPYQIMQERRIPRDKVTVESVMTSVNETIALSINSLKETRIGNVIKTLTEQKKRYALVVSEQGQKQVVKGMLSLSQIEKQLHKRIHEVMPTAGGVSDLV